MSLGNIASADPLPRQRVTGSGTGRVRGVACVDYPSIFIGRNLHPKPGHGANERGDDKHPQERPLPDDSRDNLGNHRGVDDIDIEHLLANYRRMCAKAGIDPLPDDEAREQATALMAVLVPAFEIEFRQH